MRSFSFPLYPYPTYRTPSSDGLAALLTSEAEKPPEGPSKSLVEKECADVSSARKYPSEPMAQTQNPQELVASLAQIGIRFREIDQSVSQCEENMNTIFFLVCVLFVTDLVFIAKTIISLPDESTSLESHTAWSIAIFAWFASLIVDCIVARIAISVKQLLQENEVMDSQFESLRSYFNVRLFRPADLCNSSVFQIAYYLPGLLQLAFTLFLIGCCAWWAPLSLATIFGQLVAAWLFTTALAYLVHVSSQHSPVCKMQALAVAIAREMLTASRSLQISCTAGRHSTGRDVRGVSAGEAVDDAEIAQTEHGIPFTEGVIRMLIAADFILRDDELMAAAMRLTRKRNEHSPATVIWFVSKALQHRLPHLDSLHLREESPGIVDLRGLSKQAWDVLTDTVADIVGRDLSLSTSEEEREPRPFFSALWTRIGVDILLSHSDHPLATKGEDIVSKLLSPRHVETTCRHVVKRSHDVKHVLGAVRRVLPSHRSHNHGDIFHHVLKARFCSHSCAHYNLADWAHDRHDEMRSHVESIFEVFADIVHRHISHPDDEWQPPAEETLLLMLRWAQTARGVKEEEDTSRRIFSLLKRKEEIFTSKTLSPQVVVECLRFISICTVPHYEFEKARPIEQQSILRNLTAMLERYASGSLDDCRGCGEIDIMKLARRPHWMIERAAEKSYRNGAEWQALLRALAQCLDKWRGSSERRNGATALSKTAGHCLRTISDLTVRPPEGWRRAGMAVPRELVEALHMFLRPGEYEDGCTRLEYPWWSQNCAAANAPFSRRAQAVMAGNGLVHGLGYELCDGEAEAEEEEECLPKYEP